MTRPMHVSSRRRLPRWMTKQKSSQQWIQEQVPNSVLQHIASLVDSSSKQGARSRLRASCRMFESLLPKLCCNKCETTEKIVACELCDETLMCEKHVFFLCESCGSRVCSHCRCVCLSCVKLKCLVCGACQCDE